MGLVISPWPAVTFWLIYCTWWIKLWHTCICITKIYIAFNIRVCVCVCVSHPGYGIYPFSHSFVCTIKNNELFFMWKVMERLKCKRREKFFCSIFFFFKTFAVVENSKLRKTKRKNRWNMLMKMSKIFWNTTSVDRLGTRRDDENRTSGNLEDKKWLHNKITFIFVWQCYTTNTASNMLLLSFCFYGAFDMVPWTKWQ